uniref:Uncharacterized protein n=1 Tax=Thermosporothrix sp. COM3 TaxID=2490863 RepID=A0A455SFC0_9CHLR|nr:hypothetical protein KTC_19080 [Thermosporothrix sp. COM3]
MQWPAALTWLKTQGTDDALIQPYSGHESRASLEIYSRLGADGMGKDDMKQASCIYGVVDSRRIGDDGSQISQLRAHRDLE